MQKSLSIGYISNITSENLAQRHKSWQNILLKILRYQYFSYWKKAIIVSIKVETTQNSSIMKYIIFVSFINGL